MFKLFSHFVSSHNRKKHQQTLSTNFPRMVTNPTRHQIVFSINNNNHQFTKHILYNSKPAIGDNNLFPSEINAVITVYDWYKMSNSSKSFLFYLCHHVYENPELNTTSHIYDDMTKNIHDIDIMDINGHHLRHVTHNAVTIGICQRTCFPIDGDKISRSKRSVQESLISSTITRNQFCMYAEVKRDILQLEQSILSDLPILCTMNLNYIITKLKGSYRNLQGFDPRQNRLYHQHFIYKRRSWWKLKARKVKMPKNDVFVTVVMMGFDKSLRHFYFQHFIKPFPETMTISYDDIVQENVIRTFLIMLPWSKMSFDGQSFKVISS